LQHAGHRQTSCPEMDETPSHWQPALPVLRTSADFMPLCRRSGAAVQGRPFPFHRHCRESGIGNVADGTASAFNYVEIATRGTNQQSLFLTAPGCWPSCPYRRLPLPASSSSRAGDRPAERKRHSDRKVSIWRNGLPRHRGSKTVSPVTFSMSPRRCLPSRFSFYPPLWLARSSPSPAEHR
jgi:hypothetical protein